MKNEHLMDLGVALFLEETWRTCGEYDQEGFEDYFECKNEAEANSDDCDKVWLCLDRLVELACFEQKVRNQSKIRLRARNVHKGIMDVRAEKNMQKHCQDPE